MKDQNIYIIALKYRPSDAITNRLLTIAKGLGELGVEVNIFFLASNITAERNNDKYKNVIFRYLREEQPNWLSKFKFVSFFYSIYLILKRLKEGDKVLLADYIFTLFILLSYTKVELYHERSEHPDLFFNKSMISRVQKWFYLYKCKHTAGIFVISNTIQKYFIQNKVDEKKIIIVNMTVDFNRFNGIVKQRDIEDYIAYCGTVSNSKDGVDYLIKAFSIVAKQYSTIKLYIIGKYTSEIDKDYNAALVDQLKLSERVVFTGEINANQIPQYLKNAKILALARPDNIQSSAGFPTKLGEYLLTGNPVVITRVGEIDNFLKNHESCFFAIPNDEKDFADKLTWVLQNYNQSLNVAKMGKIIAMTEFNYKTQTKKIYNAMFC